MDTFDDGPSLLDPDDWDGLTSLGHRMVDDMVACLRGVRDRRTWTRPPEDARARLRSALPVEGVGLERAYDAFRRDVLPYPTGNIHPRFWGWVIGTGTPGGMLAEMLASGMNPNAGGFDDSASLVEEQVLAWLKELMGFPAEASGILVSGGSVANLVGLAVMRNARAGFDVRRLGVAAAPQPLALYASRETHNSVRKAVELLGLGAVALREVAVDAEYRVDVDALAAAIGDDRRAGLRPIGVVANAGTVNTGAVDDLERIADLCARESLWMHVDGAFGALLAASPDLRPLVRGMERADSLAFDLHKWGYLPIEVGCTLVRDAAAHRATFAMEADYLSALSGGIAAGARTRPSQLGPQLSRGFRALKVWMGLLEHGTARLGRAIARNVRQAALLAEEVGRHPALELAAPVRTNVVCFRYVGADGAAAGEAGDAVNERILVALQESGFAVPSHTRLRGRFAIRVAIANHRTTASDLRALVAEVARLGDAQARSTGGRPGART